jgi:hypothetical protein
LRGDGWRRAALTHPAKSSDPRELFAVLPAVVLAFITLIT